MEQINPDMQVAYGAARFSADGDRLFVVTDAGAEFRRIQAIDLASGDMELITEHPWDVQAIRRPGRNGGLTETKHPPRYPWRFRPFSLRPSVDPDRKRPPP